MPSPDLSLLRREDVSEAVACRFDGAGDVPWRIGTQCPADLFQSFEIGTTQQSQQHEAVWVGFHAAEWNMAACRGPV